MGYIGRKFVTLTEAERKLKQKKGCDQPYERGHSCQLKQTQLFCIDIPGVGEQSSEYLGNEDEDIQEKMWYTEPYISFNSLISTHRYTTIKII